MKGCIAPSEIPGITSSDASIFGGIAEELIYADFCARNACVSPQVFYDDHNPAGYLYFLVTNNPHFVKSLQKDFYVQLRSQSLMRIPDIIVHKPTEKVFYEIKPRSRSGIRAGEEKVGILSAVYRYYDLPYVPGWSFFPKDHRLAFFRSVLKVILKVDRIAPGLIVYQLCVHVNGILELAPLAILLRYILKKLNGQRGNTRINPIDLQPVFARNLQLAELARILGITLAAGSTAVAAGIGWKYFWKAVAKRFAVRASVGAALSAADGPLPVGELIALGLAIWTVVDIIRLSSQLWKDAAAIAAQEA